MAADWRIDSPRGISSQRNSAIPFFLLESEQNVRHTACGIVRISNQETRRRENITFDVVLFLKSKSWLLSK